MTDEMQGSGAAGRLALGALIVLAVAAPWPYGGTAPWADRTIAVLVEIAALSTMLLAALQGRSARPAIPLWPFVGIVLLATAQLAPLPEAVHSFLAPGSARLWYPRDPRVASVLGPGPKPVSLFPRATIEWVARTGGLGALALMATGALRKRTSALFTAVALTISGFVVATYGIVARLAFGQLLYGSIPVSTVNPFGPFVNKNHFAGYVEMAALVALGLAIGLADEMRHGRGPLGWIESRKAWQILLAFGAFAAMAIAILVSLSRGGAVSLAVGLIVLSVLRLLHHRVSKKWLALSTALVMALSFSTTFILPVEARNRLLTLAGITTDSSTGFRIRTWTDSMRLALASPVFGHGFGAYSDAFTFYKTETVDTRVEHAENEYVELFAEGGAAAFALVIIGLLLTFRSTLSIQRINENRLRRGIGAGALSALAAILVHSSFDFNLRLPSNVLLFSCCTALLISTHPGPWKPMRRLALVIGSILFAFLLPSILAPQPPRTIAGIDAIQRTLKQKTPSSQRLALVENALVNHLRRRPVDAKAWVLLGWARSSQGHLSDGVTLSRYGASLDPRRSSLALAVEQLEASATANSPASH